MRTGSSRGTNRFRISAGSVASGAPGFNDVDIGDAVARKVSNDTANGSLNVCACKDNHGQGRLSAAVMLLSEIQMDVSRDDF
jgi:sulfate adenylyltransferase subunit 1 (EFTu-like GTPase family)